MFLSYIYLIPDGFVSGLTAFPVCTPSLILFPIPFWRRLAVPQLYCCLFLFLCLGSNIKSIVYQKQPLSQQRAPYTCWHTAVCHYGVWKYCLCLLIIGFGKKLTKAGKKQSKDVHFFVFLLITDIWSIIVTMTDLLFHLFVFIFILIPCVKHCFQAALHKQLAFHWNNLCNLKFFIFIIISKKEMTQGHRVVLIILYLFQMNYFTLISDWSGM